MIKPVKDTGKIILQFRLKRMQGQHSSYRAKRMIRKEDRVTKYEHTIIMD